VNSTVSIVEMLSVLKYPDSTIDNIYVAIWTNPLIPLVYCTA